MVKLTHDNVSYVKSALRIVAGSAIAYQGFRFELGWLVVGGLLLVAAEVLGIVEELVDN